VSFSVSPESVIPKEHFLNLQALAIFKLCFIRHLISAIHILGLRKADSDIHDRLEPLNRMIDETGTYEIRWEADDS